MIGLMAKASISYLKENNAKEKKEGESRSIQKLRKRANVVLYYTQNHTTCKHF